MKEEKTCQKCGKPCGRSLHEKICQKCARSLPQCYACTMICGATEWGFKEEPRFDIFVIKETDEEIILCGGCQTNMDEDKELKLEGKSRKSMKKDELVRKTELVK